MKIAITSDLHRGFSEKTHMRHDKFFKKLSQEDFDILIIAGDLGTNKQKQIEKLFAHLRKYITKPVYVVRGNHDYWSYKESFPYEQKEKYFKFICLENNIIHLNGNNIHLINGIKLYGWDNWYQFDRYHRESLGSNDVHYITSEEEHHRDVTCQQGFQQLIESQIKVDILVTHMPINVSEYKYSTHGGREAYFNKLYMLNIEPRIYIHGHTHENRDEIVQNTRIIVSGSDYDKPQYKIVEI